MIFRNGSILWQKSISRYRNKRSLIRNLFRYGRKKCEGRIPSETKNNLRKMEIGIQRGVRARSLQKELYKRRKREVGGSRNISPGRWAAGIKSDGLNYAGGLTIETRGAREIYPKITTMGKADIDTTLT